MKRNGFSQRIGIFIVLLLLLAVDTLFGQSTEGPFLATGIKIGEVTESQALVWARLTRTPKRAGIDAPMPLITYRHIVTGEIREEFGDRQHWSPIVTFPDGSNIDSIEGAVPGMPGEVRVRYRIEGTPEWTNTPWEAVEPHRDFTRTFTLRGLNPETSYRLLVETRQTGDGPAGAVMEGRFRTAPLPETVKPVSFIVTTCHRYPTQDEPGGGFKIHTSMLQRDPDFYVHTGDILYYDMQGKTEALARWHWQRMYSLPPNIEFHRQIPSYFMKDDHDTWMNDCWPGQQSPFMGEFTFEQGLAIFLEQVPMSEKTYRTFRWGRDLQIWMVEGRNYRSPNTMVDGPDKSIWGEEQKAWFKETVQASDATFRLLISPTPVVGPDRENKNDNHANRGFRYEGNELRDFLASQKNMAVINGDRHWQYVSVDPATDLREYSCGPASNQHASGWPPDRVMPQHRYLNVVGGFLSVTVDREEGRPVIIFRHHDVNGAVLNEDRIEAE